MIKTGGHGYLEWLAEKTAKGIKVYWICSTRAWARSREASLCDKIPVGVSYVTVDDFITERWELEGDGRRIVSRNLRELIALKLLSCINEKDSAHPLPERPEFVRGVASFLESTSGRGNRHGTEVLEVYERSPREENMFKLREMYLAEIQESGLIEQMQAVEFLPNENRPFSVVMDGWENRSAIDCSVMDYLEASDIDVLRLSAWQGAPLAEHTNDDDGLCSDNGTESLVMVGEEPDLKGEETGELLELTAAVLQRKTGRVKPQEPEGALHILEVHGQHVEEAAMLGAVKAELDKGISATDICVAIPRGYSRINWLMQVFHTAGIPLCAYETTPIIKTSIGEQMFAIFNLYGKDGNEDDITAAQAFVAAGVNGVSNRDCLELDKMRRQKRLLSGKVFLTSIMNRNRTFRDLVECGKSVVEAKTPVLQMEAFDRYSNAVTKLLTVTNGDADDERQTQRERKALDVMRKAITEASGMGQLFDFRLMELMNMQNGMSVVEEDASKCVQVLNALDVYPRNFKVIVACGMNATAYPLDREASPLEDLARQANGYKLATEQERVRAVIAHLLESTEERIVLQYTLIDGDDSTRQSALVEQMLDIYRVDELDEEGNSDDGVIPRKLKGFIATKTEADIQDLMPAASEVQRKRKLEQATGGRLLTTRRRGEFHELEMLLDPEHEFSVTEIDAYLECPYKWFFGKRLRPKEIDTEFGPIERGRIFHGALERFYREIVIASEDGADDEERQEGDTINPLLADGRVNADNLAEAKERIAVCVDQYMVENKDNVFARNELERQMVEGYKRDLAAFLERDATFLPKYQPKLVEFAFGRRHDRGVRYAGVPVGGRIDRIDVEAETGNAVIMDYKASSVAKYQLPAKGDIVGASAIQAQLYATVVGALFDYKPVGSIYRSILTTSEGGAWDRDCFGAGSDFGLKERNAVPRAKDAVGDAKTGSAGADDGGTKSTEENGGEILGACQKRPPCSFEEYLTLTEEYVAEQLERLFAGDIEPRPAPWLPSKTEACRNCPAKPVCGGPR